MSTRKRVTWHRAAKLAAIFLVFIFGVTQFPAAGARSRPHSLAALASFGGFADMQAPPQQQSPQQQPPKPTPDQRATQKDEPYRITRDVNLVVLLASVVDSHARFLPDLKQENFRVYEDRVEQKLSVFRREDIPITLGLVVDNSGSMRDKRERVNSAAITFVKTSQRNDEVFVVNFNDEFYLDLDKDFSNDPVELREALERIDSRGSTALYDAVIGSLDHLKKGTRDKKILLIVTDGEDNASRTTLEAAVQEAHKSDAAIYAIGLLESKREGKRARKALLALTTATGGMSFFPESVKDVEAICNQIANDIRNQYVLAYYPTNSVHDGTFRSVHVDVNPPRGTGKVEVRTRTGYYAQRAGAAK
ncbi:MAG: VWA domain-containing protein [Acidipila sp.]|nr:VWA domain-containing protein [Acidipila sp.]